MLSSEDVGGMHFAALAGRAVDHSYWWPLLAAEGVKTPCLPVLPQENYVLTPKVLTSRILDKELLWDVWYLLDAF